MVDAAGAVVATVFASTTNPAGQAAGNAGFAIPDSIVGKELAHARTSAGVGTGPCAG
jgi:hypothetical protein